MSEKRLTETECREVVMAMTRFAALLRLGSAGDEGSESVRKDFAIILDAIQDRVDSDVLNEPGISRQLAALHDLVEPR